MVWEEGWRGKAPDYFDHGEFALRLLCVGVVGCGMGGLVDLVYGKFGDGTKLECEERWSGVVWWWIG